MLGKRLALKMASQTTWGGLGKTVPETSRDRRKKSSRKGDDGACKEGERCVSREMRQIHEKK